ncbi:VIII-A, partial [Symbiodinium necroappetens]
MLSRNSASSRVCLQEHLQTAAFVDAVSHSSRILQAMSPMIVGFVRLRDWLYGGEFNGEGLDVVQNWNTSEEFLQGAEQVYRHALGVALAPPSSEESDIVLVHRAREWLEDQRKLRCRDFADAESFELTDVIFVQSSDQSGSILAVQVDTATTFRDSSRWWRPRSEKHVELIHRSQAMETSPSCQPADPGPASSSVMGVSDDKACAERAACKAADTSSSDDLEQNQNAWYIKQQSEGHSSTSATRTPPLTADTQVESNGSRGSRNSADSVAARVNTNSGTSDDSSNRGKNETRLDAARAMRGAMHRDLSSSSSSDFEFFDIPGLDSDSAGSEPAGSQAEDSAEPAQNSMAAHLNGTCKPC